VPQASGAQVLLPATLAIGSNRPNVYMAFGDSLSSGEGSSDGTGYRGPLANLLGQALNRGEVLDRGAEGTTSSEGADRVGRGLRSLTPAYTLILYGTNDWNFSDCETKFPCFTIDSLRTIVKAAKEAQSQPFVATLPPGNPSDPRVPKERNEWTARISDLIRPMAREEGAVLVDLQAAFVKEGDLTKLFSDHVHPNDRGYALMANEWFKAITGASASSSACCFPAESFSETSFGFVPPALSARRGRLPGARPGVAPGGPRSQPRR
jgi:lysophospholipase L1-like esterase